MWIVPAIAGGIACLAVAIWPPWHKGDKPSQAVQVAPSASEAQQLVAKAWEQLDKTELGPEELAISDGFCKRAADLEPTNAEVWAAWHPEFSDYDVVIQNCNDISHGPKWPEPVQKDFEDFVRNGGGVYIFHSAENAFVGWKEYERMVGLCWRKADYGTSIRVNDDEMLVRIPPGEGGNTSHGPRGDVLITRLGNDPIHDGMPRQWLTPGLEVYYYARGPATNVTVLAYARDSKPGQGLLWPVEWTVSYGKGRVYVSTYGHVWKGDVQPASMRCAAVQTIIPRVVQWLAKRPVTIPVPPDFPGTNAVSIRPEIQLPPAS